jgi:hypothetical protein
MLQFMTMTTVEHRKSARDVAAAEHVLQNAVKRFSLYPSSGKFGRVDGLRYTTLTLEGALNRVGNDAFLIKVMV